ncbi:MAG: peptide deformylase [Saprospiraceae bacterium]|nr:peptide deformylase [Saprospiraceae bacterium]
MILPIYAYGTKILKKKADDIGPEFEELSNLISNMWETMYNARGVGLAAPQIGKAIRIFIIDTTQLNEEDETGGIKRVFINAHEVASDNDLWTYEEGCLSIPEVRGDVDRPRTITLRYCTEDFVEKVETFTDVEARVIQHEYDHIEGLLFTEFLKPVKKRRIKRKLEQIKKGIVDAEYPMRFV